MFNSYIIWNNRYLISKYSSTNVVHIYNKNVNTQYIRYFHCNIQHYNESKKINDTSLNKDTQQQDYFNQELDVDNDIKDENAIDQSLDKAEDLLKGNIGNKDEKKYKLFKNISHITNTKDEKLKLENEKYLNEISNWENDFRTNYKGGQYYIENTSSDTEKQLYIKNRVLRQKKEIEKSNLEYKLKIVDNDLKISSPSIDSLPENSELLSKKVKFIDTFSNNSLLNSLVDQTNSDNKLLIDSSNITPNKLLLDNGIDNNNNLKEIELNDNTNDKIEIENENSNEIVLDISRLKPLHFDSGSIENEFKSLESTDNNGNEELDIQEQILFDQKYPPLPEPKEHHISIVPHLIELEELLAMYNEGKHLLPFGTVGRMILLDCSYYPEKFQRNPYFEYLQERLPNSRFIDFEHDFSWKCSSEMKFDLPKPSKIQRVLSRLGINKDDHIIVYDRGGLYSSPKCWFILKLIGHPRVSVLQGLCSPETAPKYIFDKWTAIGGNLDKRGSTDNNHLYNELDDIEKDLMIGIDFNDPNHNLNSSLSITNNDNSEVYTKDILTYPEVTYNDDMLATHEQITYQASSLVHIDQCQIIDTRTNARFRGIVHEYYSEDVLQGRVAGSINIPIDELLIDQETGKFLSMWGLRNMLINQGIMGIDQLDGYESSRRMSSFVDENENGDSQQRGEDYSSSSNSNRIVQSSSNGDIILYSGEGFSACKLFFILDFLRSEQRKRRFRGFINNREIRIYPKSYAYYSSTSAPLVLPRIGGIRI